MAENFNEQGSEPERSADENSDRPLGTRDQKSFEPSAQKSLKTPKKVGLKLPLTALIILIPILIIALAVFLGGTKSSDSFDLSDNISDSSINWGNYTSSEIELSDSLKITSGGVYTLSREISDGMIEIDAGTADVKLILNGVSVTNSNGPALLVLQADHVVIETVAGTTNTFSDSSIYENWDEDICAAIFSKDDLILQGEGTLTVNGNFEDGIVSKDDLKIISGTYVIDAKDDGIRGRDSLYIVDGNFDITSGGDGLKSNNSEETGKGTILIDGGYVSISAGDDGVHAESTLEINGGTIVVKKSYEGLEGARITINGGDIHVASSDDGLNAAGGNDSSSPNMGNYQSSSSTYSIVINGGRVYVTSSGDGIDSNGTLTINGGEVIVDGPTNSGNGALDAEGSITFNGGSIVAVGASGMTVAPDSSSEGLSISVFFSSTYSSGTVLSLKNSSGETILEHTSQKSFSHAVLSSDKLVEGETYTLYLNGEEYASMTLVSKTTVSGTGGFTQGGGFNMGGGDHGGGARRM